MSQNELMAMKMTLYILFFQMYSQITTGELCDKNVFNVIILNMTLFSICNHTTLRSYM